jgi:predicted Abi (CAAX) family protease
MSARLTPTSVAEREIARLQQRADRLQAELQDVAIERSRWERVLDTLNGDDPYHNPATEA